MLEKLARMFLGAVLSWSVSCLAHAQDVKPFRPTELLDFHALEQVVRENAPALQERLRQLSLARADAHQSRLFGNPSLDGAWSTIPLGATNPKDLQRPYANVPSYGVGLSYTFPLAKRGPRRERADALYRASEAELAAGTRAAALELASSLGDLATATLRHEGVLGLVDSAHRSVELASARVHAQFGAPLDVDRLTVDLQRTEQQLARADGEIRASLAACSSLVAAPCERFADADVARAYLTRWTSALEGRDAALSERPDLRALEAYAQASRADVKLAKAEAVPDPTVRVGYLHDRFVISGNQLNSVNLAVSVPLPLFDRGQAKREAAEASQRFLSAERQKRLDVARARVPALIERVALQRARCTTLSGEVLPRARKVLEDLEAAAEKRLIPLTDVIQARRTLGELFVEEADSCGDAYSAALALIQETSLEGTKP